MNIFKRSKRRIGSVSAPSSFARYHDVCYRQRVSIHAARQVKIEFAFLTSLCLFGLCPPRARCASLLVSFLPINSYWQYILSIISALCREERIVLECGKCTCLLGLQRPSSRKFILATCIYTMQQLFGLEIILYIICLILKNYYQVMTSHFYLAEHSLRIGKSATRPWEAQASKQVIGNTNPLIWRGYVVQSLRKCQILTCRQTVHVLKPLDITVPRGSGIQKKSQKSVKLIIIRKAIYLRPSMEITGCLQIIRSML